MIRRYYPYVIQMIGFLLIFLSYPAVNELSLFSFYTLLIIGISTVFAGGILQRKSGSDGGMKGKYYPYTIQITGFFLILVATLYPAGIALSPFSFYALSIIGSLTVVTGGLIERRVLK